LKIKFYIILFYLFFIFLLSPLLSKEEKKEDFRPMTVDDVINIEKPYQLRMSPDNKTLIWVQYSVDEEKNKHIANIWMAAVTGGKEPVQLTRGKSSSRQPQWSPDGKEIAFLSDRIDNKDQIFTIYPYGGEASLLFKSNEDIHTFRWKDNKTIIFLTREDKYYYEEQLEDAKDDAEVVDDIKTFVPQRLFSYSLEDKKIKRLTLNNDQITTFTVSPDGNWAVTVHTDSPLYGLDPKYLKKYYLLNLKDLSMKQIFTEKYFQPYDLKWDKDGTLYFIDEKSSYEEKKGPGIPLLYEYNVKTNICKEVPLNWSWGIGLLEGRLFDSEGGKVVTTLAEGVVNHLVILNKSNGQWTRLEDPKSSNISDFVLTNDGKGMAFVYSTANKPFKLYYGEFDGNKFKNVITLADLNKGLDKVFLTRRDIIKWKSEGDREIEGILFYPKEYKEGQKYPLIVQIHGGPSWYDPDIFDTSWAYYPHILSAKNSFVLAVNYSGSANYGLAFMESIIGHYYELEVPDILSGIDSLIGKGMVDPEKLGTMGWSNGSILSIALTTETERFKVACCGAGNVNWLSDYGNCSFGVAFDNLYFKGPYWEHLEHYIASSPLFKMNKVITPTLIIFGDSDTTVPTEQGYEHYRALQQMEKAPVRFVLMPGEPHSLRKISHQKRKMEEELAWFDKYLFNEKSEVKNRSFMEGSPMDIMLKKSDFSYDGKGNLGVIYKDILIPETVEYEGLKVGRFEVTRSQFEAFLKENKDFDTTGLIDCKENSFKGGTGNYPVSGINLEKARAYCDWLSNKTGNKYRLPESKEMEKWLKDCNGNENTLDYWSGYSISPDEISELEDYIKKLESAQGIILPCGFFSESVEKIYDLNGNVSEICSDGSVTGLSARHISDKRQPYNPPGINYTGFRVVMEK